MIKISTKGRYALRVMVYLAVTGEGVYKSALEISKHEDIDFKYLEQIMPILLKAGFLQSIRGSSGGYCLIKHPRMYRVGDIVRSAEGNLAPVSCLETPINMCDRKNECLTLPMWQGLYDVINNYLDNITLEQLILQYASKVADNYMI
jgi:Rrf2 family protein